MRTWKEARRQSHVEAESAAAVRPLVAMRRDADADADDAHNLTGRLPLLLIPLATLARLNNALLEPITDVLTSTPYVARPDVYQSKSTRMDAQRALLDELMGAERDVPLQQRSHRQLHFTDPGVCKYELAGVCPNQLFTNTRSDLGACRSSRDRRRRVPAAPATTLSRLVTRRPSSRLAYTRNTHPPTHPPTHPHTPHTHAHTHTHNHNHKTKTGPCRALYHSDHLEWPAVAAQWEDEARRPSPRERARRYPYERDLRARLEQLVRDMDRRVERARERAAAESAPRPLQPQDARRLEDAESRALEALRAAEGAGEAGDVLAALEAAGAASELRAASARQRQQLTQPERVLTVCDVCGIFISSTDNEARRLEHVTGKQYLGWKRLREALRAMEQRADDGAEGAGEEEEEEAGGGRGGRGYRERETYGHHHGHHHHHARRDERHAPHHSRGPRSRGGSREPDRPDRRPRGGGGGGGGRDGDGGVPPPAGLYAPR
jgi:hypothetical protein